jgi:hypothetical protein
MTVLSVVKDVCLAVGVNPPTTLFGNSTQARTRDEMLSLANEMAQRIAYDYRDWQTLYSRWIYDQPQWTPAGDSVSVMLPEKYKRMYKDGNVWRVGQPIPLRFISSYNDWNMLANTGALAAYTQGYWQIAKDRIIIGPPPPDDAAFLFEFVTKDCIALAAGGDGDVFQGDNDKFKVDERLLKLGMLWQWKANKGSPYAEDMSTFYDAMSVLAGSDMPAPIIVDRLPISASAPVAIPWPSHWGPQ